MIKQKGGVCVTQRKSFFKGGVTTVLPCNNWLADSLAGVLCPASEERVAPIEGDDKPEDLLKSRLLYPAGRVIVR